MTHLFVAALLALSLIGHAHAGKAHVHGAGNLDVSIDKDRLTIALELPLDAAVGFEHAPATAKEKSELDLRIKALNNGVELFVPTPAAGCVLQSATISNPFKDGKASSAHADIDAEYVFRCAKPSALKGFETRIFNDFKRLYRLEVQRVGPSGQGQARLSPKQPALSW